MHRATELYESRKNFVESSRTSYLINALYDAVVDGDLGTVNFLLTTKKVNPNILLEDYDAAPLHTATGIGTEELAVKLVQLLLDNCANPNIKTSDCTTPLMVSCLWGRPIVTNILLNYGADPWMKDSEGKNALDYASENGYYEMHEILKNTSVDVTITSDDTVADYLPPSKSFYIFSGSLINEAPNCISNESHKTSPYFNINCELSNKDNGSESACYRSVGLLNTALNDFAISSDETVTEHTSLNRTFYTFPKLDIETQNIVKFQDFSDEALKFDSRGENNSLGSGCLDTAFLGFSNSQNSVSSTGTFLSFAHKDVSIPLVERDSNKEFDLVSQKYDHKSSFSEQHSESNSSVISYGTDRIKEELKKNHITHGPVTKTTKKVYQNLIKKVIKGSKKNFLQNNKFSSYPEILQSSFKECYTDSIKKWSNLEELMSKNFANDKRIWRGGKEKQFFTYLLLDPFITNDLPRKRLEMSDIEIWKTFVLSIFYVGKGKNSRPFSHLFEALKCNVKKTVSKKVLRIQKIWTSSAGIICLHLFHNIISAEAHTREAAMIDAIGLRNLTNIQSGEYYGVVKNWSIKQKQQLGIVLLNKALQIYLAEGERQIFPCDLT